MVLKRLPVLFFLLQKVQPRGRLQLRKGLREGSGMAKSAHKSLLHLKYAFKRINMQKYT